jgi:3D (Asp-Asp-Asp) domain-containing protein
MSGSETRRSLIVAITLEAALLLSGCATSTPRIAPVTDGAPEANIVSKPEAASSPSRSSPSTASNTSASRRSTWETGQTFSRAHWKQFPEPRQSEIVEAFSLYGTYYHTRMFDYVADGIPILDLSGKPLGPKLSVNDFCKAADAGAFRAPQSAGRGLAAYTIAGAPSVADSQADCSPVYKTNLDLYEQGKTQENWPSIVAALERTRFRTTMASYGNGKGTHRLVPWRTVATYNSQIPQGTILYIPRMRGAKVTLPSGQTATHDGYFFAADAGSGIKSDHIDFFAGTVAPKPLMLPAIHEKDGRFTAYVIRNDEIAGHFRELHQMD